MTGQHWTVILLVLGGLFGQIISLPSWHEALTPAFIGSTGLALVGLLRSMFLPAVQQPADSVKVPRP